MAITYGAKLFESESTSRVVAHPLTAAVKAGALICIALAGKRSGAYLNVSSIKDSKGHVWDWKMFQSEFRACGVAWCRTPVAMTTADTITVSWNGTPTYAWKSAHSFEGAAGSPTDEKSGSGSGSTASVTLDVTGSDWLTFASLILPDEFGVTATPLNSSTSRDTNGHSSSTPWCECFSRNGTSGSTHTIGASLPVSTQYGIVGVSFPYEALTAPASTARAFAFLGGV